MQNFIKKWSKHNYKVTQFFQSFYQSYYQERWTVEKLKQRRLTPALISITAKLYSNYLCGVYADTNIKSGYYNFRTIFKRYVE